MTPEGYGPLQEAVCQISGDKHDTSSYQKSKTPHTNTARLAGRIYACP